MSKTLKISNDLSLPLDAVTQTFLVVGKRGSGKSNTAARFVEQLHKARLPFVVLDPVDTWWGLKAGADGGPGLKDIYVFGGQKKDLPLEPNGGALIADVLCEHRVSMVLSVKHLSGKARSGFMVAFAQTLFQKWTGGPLHVVLEEAHELAPQMAGGRGGDTDGESAMLGAFKRLWKLGRSQGIGGTAVTQRPASLSKDITTQSEILIAHRTIGPQDVAAIGQWVKYHGEQGDMLKDLPSLPTGQAFIWAPEFPEGKPIGLERVTVLRRETYDSASTPRVGEQRTEPKELAPVDLERLRTKMEATIERAKLDDPKVLRAQLVERDKRIKELENAKPIPGVRLTAKDAPPALTDADRALMADIKAEFREFVDAIATRADAVLGSIAERAKAEIDKSAVAWTTDVEKRRALFIQRLEQTRVQRVLNKDKIDQATPVVAVTRHTPPTRSTTPRPSPAVSSGSGSSRPAPVAGSGDDNLTPAKRRILKALAWADSVRLPAPRKERLAFLADASPTSSSFTNNLGSLRTAGLIEYPQLGTVALTDEGRKHAQVDDSIPTTSHDLQVAIFAKLPNPQSRIVRELVKVYPDAIDKEALAQRSEASATSSSFTNNLGALRSLGLIDYPQRGIVAAAPVLFLEST